MVAGVVSLLWQRSVSLDFSSYFPRNPSRRFQASGASGEFPSKAPLTSLAHNLNETICLCAAVKNFHFRPDARNPPTPHDSISPPPLFSLSSLKIVSVPSLHLITVSLWTHFIVSLFHFQEGCRRLRLTLHNQSPDRSTEQHRDKVRSDY